MVRLAQLADLNICYEMDKSYLTDHVWQMQSHEKSRSIEARFDVVRLPRQMKVDVTFDEIIVNAPVARPLIRSFSDEPEPPLRVAVYPLEEICAEKMRTLLQRTEPRDLYDLWRILSERADAMDAQKLATTLRVKCEHRGVSFTHVSALLSPERVSKYRGAWERRLREQTPDIPPLNTVVRETRRLLRTFVG